MSPAAASAPVFVSNPVRVVATLGKDVLLECKPRASPKPRVTWKRNDRRIQPGKRYSKSLPPHRESDRGHVTNWDWVTRFLSNRNTTLAVDDEDVTKF